MFLGLFGLLSTLIPLPAIVPILLYIGLLIGAQHSSRCSRRTRWPSPLGGDSQRRGLDKRYYWAAGYCEAGAALSFIGLIHGEQVAWAAAPGVALGYVFRSGGLPGVLPRQPTGPAAMLDEHTSVAGKIPEQPGPAKVAAESAR